MVLVGISADAPVTPRKPAVLISEYDDLRPSAELLVGQAVAAGCAVERRLCPGMLHGHLNRTPVLAEVDASLAEIARVVRGSHPLPTGDPDSVVGKRFVYTYDNGWTYELYVKNARTIDYRIHSRMVGGRWVKGQEVDLVELARGVWKVSWTEPTGTSVVVTLMPRARALHGTIFFPRWVHEHPERTVLFQNDHLDRMRELRDAGPTYPIHVVAEFARIARIDDVGPDNEAVIDRSPADLPPGWPDVAAAART